MANLIADLDEEDDDIQKCGQLGKEADDEEDGDNDLDASVEETVAAGTRATTFDLDPAEPCESNAEHNANDEWCDLLEGEERREN